MGNGGLRRRPLIGPHFFLNNPGTEVFATIYPGTRGPTHGSDTTKQIFRNSLPIVACLWSWEMELRRVPLAANAVRVQREFNFTLFNLFLHGCWSTPTLSK